MTALSTVLEDCADNGLLFHCPGCNMAHQVKHGEGHGPRWTWNGDMDKPTFTPSINVRFEHWVPPFRPGTAKPENQTLVKDVCHSFVTDGRIQFLADCTHALAGQTVDLPPFDWY